MWCWVIPGCRAEPCTHGSCWPHILGLSKQDYRGGLACEAPILFRLWTSSCVSDSTIKWPIPSSSSVLLQVQLLLHLSDGSALLPLSTIPRNISIAILHISTVRCWCQLFVSIFSVHDWLIDHILQQLVEGNPEKTAHQISVQYQQVTTQATNQMWGSTIAILWLVLGLGNPLRSTEMYI